MGWYMKGTLLTSLDAATLDRSRDRCPAETNERDNIVTVLSLSLCVCVCEAVDGVVAAGQQDSGCMLLDRIVLYPCPDVWIALTSFRKSKAIQRWAKLEFVKRNGSCAQRAVAGEENQ